MWSLGVILHVLLTGRNPFNDETTMFSQIANARYSLDDPDWSGVSGKSERASLVIR
jgi:serine/threonine protein kinase